MSNEDLLKLAESLITKAPDTVSIEGVQGAMISSIAASLLVIARNSVHQPATSMDPLTYQSYLEFMQRKSPHNNS